MISKSIPIRFDADVVEQIDYWANRIGIKRSGVVKLAVILQLRAISTGRIDLHFDGLVSDLHLREDKGGGGVRHCSVRKNLLNKEG